MLTAEQHGDFGRVLRVWDKPYEPDFESSCRVSKVNPLLFMSTQNGHDDIAVCPLEAGTDRDKTEFMCAAWWKLALTRTRLNKMEPRPNLWSATQIPWVVGCMLEAGTDTKKAAGDGARAMHADALRAMTRKGRHGVSHPDVAHESSGGCRTARLREACQCLSQWSLPASSSMRVGQVTLRASAEFSMYVVSFKLFRAPKHKWDSYKTDSAANAQVSRLSANMTDLQGIQMAYSHNRSLII